MKLEGTYSGIPSPATLRNEMAATMIAEAMFNLRDILEAKWISALLVGDFFFIHSWRRCMSIIIYL